MNRRFISIVWLICFFVVPARAQEENKKPGMAYVHIDSVVITGTRQTRREIILREMSVQQGSVIRSDSVAAIEKLNELRLYNLTIFTESTVSHEKIDEERIRLHVHVRERWNIIPEASLQLADRNFNVWWNEFDADPGRANLELTIRNKNFRGRLENLAVTAQVGYTQKAGLSYYIPYLDKNKKHGIGTAFQFARSREVNYATDNNKLRFYHNSSRFNFKNAQFLLYYTYRPAYAFRHTLQLGYKQFWVADSVLYNNPGYYLNGSRALHYMELLYRVDMNKVDNWNYPLRGFKTVFYAIGRAGFEGMEQQALFNLESAYFKPVGSKWYGSVILRAKTSFGRRQPYLLQSGLGTRTDYVRGYEYYVMDCQHYGLLRFDWKYALLEKEYKHIPFRYLSSIPLRIYPKIFADAGVIGGNYGYNNKFANGTFLYSAGVGIDIVTAYDFKIRLEYTWNHLRQNDLFIHTNSE